MCCLEVDLLHDLFTPSSFVFVWNSQACVKSYVGSICKSIWRAASVKNFRCLPLNLKNDFVSLFQLSVSLLTFLAILLSTIEFVN